MKIAFSCRRCSDIKSNFSDGLIVAHGDSISHKQIRVTSATEVVYILAHSVNDRMSVLLLSL